MGCAPNFEIDTIWRPAPLIVWKELRREKFGVADVLEQADPYENCATGPDRAGLISETDRGERNDDSLLVTGLFWPDTPYVRDS